MHTWSYYHYILLQLLLIYICGALSHLHTNMNWITVHFVKYMMTVLEYQWSCTENMYLIQYVINNEVSPYTAAVYGIFELDTRQQL